MHIFGCYHGIIVLVWIIFGQPKLVDFKIINLWTTNNNNVTHLNEYRNCSNRMKLATLNARGEGDATPPAPHPRAPARRPGGARPDAARRFNRLTSLWPSVICTAHLDCRLVTNRCIFFLLSCLFLNLEYFSSAIFKGLQRSLNISGVTPLDTPL